MKRGDLDDLRRLLAVRLLVRLMPTRKRRRLEKVWPDQTPTATALATTERLRRLNPSIPKRPPSVLPKSETVRPRRFR